MFPTYDEILAALDGLMRQEIHKANCDLLSDDLPTRASGRRARGRADDLRQAIACVVQAKARIV